MALEDIKKYSPAIVRISLALVFLWFSLNQFFLVNDFVSLIPDFLVNATGYSPAVFVIINAIFEFALGIFLLLGLHVRFSSLLLGLHLIGIAISVGYGPTMIRDLGLALATVSVFFHGADEFCLDNHIFGEKLRKSLVPANRQ